MAEKPQQQKKEPDTGVLRSDVEFIRKPEPMLFDRQSDAYYRLGPANLEILSFMTVSQPVSEFVESLNRHGLSTTKDEVMKLLAFLQQNNLLEPQYGVVAMKREKAMEMREKTTFLRFSSAYIFFKLPPFRPDRLYRRIAPYVSWLCGRALVRTLAVPAVLGYLLLVRDFGMVSDAFLASLSWAGLVKYFAAIVALKVVHESAHSLAAMHFGCRVRGVGLGFMVFVPRFFTDTTDAWRLPRSQRLLIDGAGILSELLVGGIAALCWAYAAPGAWKSTLFYVFAVSTISTLFVNGNPCIRYDGYYILSDLVRIDNLMMRSGEHFKAWWRHVALGLGPRPRDARGAFLLVFGACTFVYRIFLYTSIILIIYHKFTKVLALGMMVLELFSILIYPMWREMKTVTAMSKREGVKAKTWFWLVAVLCAFVVASLPLSWSVELAGEVTRERRHLVAVDEGGFLVRPSLRPVPRAVTNGECIVSLEMPSLDFACRRLEGTLRCDRMLKGFQDTDAEEFALAGVTARKIESDERGLAEFRRRQGLLTLRSAADGLFVPAVPHELSRGAFVPRGQVLGKVLSGRLVVDAYAQDDDIGKLSVGDGAKVLFPGRLRARAARVVETDLLPAQLVDSPLLQSFGGPVPVVPDAARPGAFKTAQSLYRVRLELAGDADGEPIPRLGRTCRVEVGHSERLVSIVWRSVMSVFRKEF